MSSTPAPPYVVRVHTQQWIELWFQTKILNESLNVVLHRSTENLGEIVTLIEVLADGNRALVKGRADQEMIMNK